MHEFLTRLISNYLFELFLPNILVIVTGNQYRLTDFLPMRVLDSSYRGLESCQIDVLYLMRFVDKGFAFIPART
jgi:hypothetical protein